MEMIDLAKINLSALDQSSRKLVGSTSHFHTEWER